MAKERRGDPSKSGCEPVEWLFPLRGRWLRYAVTAVGWVAGIGIAICVLPFVVMAIAFGPQIHWWDAAAFHQKETAKLLALPTEAELLEVKKQNNIYDLHYTVRFRLPETRTPDQWVRQIWASNRFVPGARKGEASYSAYHNSAERIASEIQASRKQGLSHSHLDRMTPSALHHGHRSIEYHWLQRVYVAEIDTD